MTLNIMVEFSEQVFGSMKKLLWMREYSEDKLVADRRKL